VSYPNFFKKWCISVPVLIPDIVPILVHHSGIHVNVDAGSDDENVQVPSNMGKVKRSMHGEKDKEKKFKKGNKMSNMTFVIREFTEVSRQRFKHRVAKTSASCVGESKRKLEQFSLDKVVKALSVYKDMSRAAYPKVMKALYKKENRIAFFATLEDRKIEWMDSIADESFCDYE
jgi:hypothetical protein